MSSALNNIRKALYAIAELNAYPRSAEGSIFIHPGNMRIIDESRDTFYLDEKSKVIFDWVCQNRIITGLYGHDHGAVLENTPFPKAAWAALERQARTLPSACADDYLLDRIDTWILESYSLKGRCEVQAGDTILDCGAYTGNTSAYFSQKTGPAGHVYGFEPHPVLFEHYKRNMRELSNVTPINCAVSRKKEILSFEDLDSGSRITKNSSIKVYAVGIDEFVQSQKIEKIDFIKMDIEGAEEDALHGAANTIKTFKPKLALSAYHKEADILTLPRLIRAIADDYRFALRHFSNNYCETVLYCF